MRLFLIISWLNRHTDLCMWDRWQWGRPRRQRERPRGRKVSETPVWSACPSGTAGRRRLGGVQTHLRQATDRNKRMSKHTTGTQWIFEQAPFYTASCRVQSRFYVVKKWRRRTLGRILHKAVRRGPLQLLMQMWKTNIAGQRISNAWDRYVWISPSLSLALSFCSRPPSVTLFSSVPLLCHFLRAVFSGVSLFAQWIPYKKLIEGWFPSLSSPLIPLTNLVWNPRTPPLAHHHPRQVAPISKVKPLPVSWRGAMVLTRLSLHATLPASGADISRVPTVALSLSSCLPLRSLNATTRCSEQLLPWRHENTLALWETERGGSQKQRAEEMIFFVGHSSKPLYNTMLLVL